MSETTPDGGHAAVRPPGEPHGAPDAEAAILAELAQDYQTHCGECFLGHPEHCTEGLAPNGQPCVTTPAQRIAWLLDVVQQVVAQRNTAAGENAALTARLAEAEADAEEARTVTRQADRAARDMGARLAAVEAQDARWRALVGALAEAAVSVCTLLEPASMMHDACDGIEGHFADLCRGCIAERAYQVTQAALWVAQAALADAPSPTH